MLEKLKERVARWTAARSIRKYGGEQVAPVEAERPQNEWTVAFLTTAGVHLSSEEPFDVDAGDWSVRSIPADTAASELMVSHTHYDTEAAEEDINTVFPLEAVRELAEEGEFGKLAATHYGMMGYIPRTDKLLQESVPEIIAGLKKDNVDVLLLSPG
ncbi:glycine/sarcosine/betaine reductase selenoprotein B family protein [Alkalicoccus chagannorensis]|nr:glycine/sarcosine/betaine reductase selenoprotein B family protein [Alkalicoccus chagannorensis]